MADDIVYERQTTVDGIGDRNAEHRCISDTWIGVINGVEDQHIIKFQTKKLAQSMSVIVRGVNHRIRAKIQVYYSMGLIIGPPLAGFLYQLGEIYGVGFCVPFYVFGIIAIFSSVIMHFTVKTEQLYVNTGNVTFFQLLSNVGIVINVLITINSGALIGFNTTTLELHLEDIASLSPSMVGLVFLTSGISLVVFNHIWEHLAEKISNKFVISLIGCFSALICLTIIGPIPMIKIKPQLYLVIIAQVLLGLGISAILVGTFAQGSRENIQYDLQWISVNIANTP
ncbi:unnamed protein product [Medioppia subpectinata]|uniref:Uncharacterized protein n=1 Tax=Medioppia subpectinata TaxID=1979941 RepID=A0A7R9KVQ4_9ACAR|nr:unnamed protein product [Medioppia subpectinata]CAG2110602.1 unnamed protein product [Medioppia subpectinata]